MKASVCAVNLVHLYELMPWDLRPAAFQSDEELKLYTYISSL